MKLQRRVLMRTMLSPFVASMSWLATVAQADDWPQFRGPNRDGVWNETGVMQVFPADGLKVRWRVPVGGGLSSPIVSGGRVFLCDSETKDPKAWERVHCFDEKTGGVLWTHTGEVSYPK